MKLEVLDGFGACATTSTTPKKDFVPVKSLIAQGYVITQDFLSTLGITSKSDGNGNQVFDTLNGTQKLPEVLTQESAQALPGALAQANTLKPDNATPADIDKNFKSACKWLLWLAAAWGGYKLLTYKRKPASTTLGTVLASKPATRLKVVHL